MRDIPNAGRGTALLALTLALFAPASAHAQTADRLGGHLSLGYARLFISDAPGGSLSVAGGVDYPVAGDLRIGADVGFSLLGSRAVERSGQTANLDYTLFEAALLAHWKPSGLGPIGRISVGPELMSARAELSTAGGGLAFTGLAIEQLAPGAAFDVTLLKKSSRSPVVAGLELGVHAAFLPSETWTLANLRLAIHY